MLYLSPQKSSLKHIVSILYYNIYSLSIILYINDLSLLHKNVTKVAIFRVLYSYLTFLLHYTIYLLYIYFLHTNTMVIKMNKIYSIVLTLIKLYGIIHIK